MVEWLNLNTRTYEPGEYEVTLTFTLDGVLGREAFRVQVFFGDHASPVTLAFKEFEQALIEEGIPTFECGCCIDYGQIRVPGVSVVQCLT